MVVKDAVDQAAVEDALRAWDRQDDATRKAVYVKLKEFNEGPVECGMCSRPAVEVQEHENCNGCCLVDAEMERFERDLAARLFLAKEGDVDVSWCFMRAREFMLQAPDHFWEATKDKLRRFGTGQ